MRHGVLVVLATVKLKPRAACESYDSPIFLRRKNKVTGEEVPYAKSPLAILRGARAKPVRPATSIC